MAQTEPSDRQQAVMRHAKAGKSIPDIAKAMKISTNGVRDHLRRLRDMGVEVDIQGRPYGADAQGGANNAPRQRKRRAPASEARPSHTAVSEAIADVKLRIDALENRREQLQEEHAALDREAENIDGQLALLRGMIDAVDNAKIADVDAPAPAVSGKELASAAAS